MLRDRYEPDPRFWAIIEYLAIDMEPELAQIDKVLEDDELFQLIKNDLAQRHPHTLETGRNWCKNCRQQSIKPFQTYALLNKLLDHCERGWFTVGMCSG
jgi:hypothetical protein